MTAEPNGALRSPATILESALELGRGRIPVFPCRRNKSPYIAGGFHAANTDDAMIRGWWSRFPNALIGVPTGSASGIVVIDVDPDGMDFLLGDYGELLETGRRHKTPRGFHYLFRAPTDLSIRNSVRKLAPGVDVRGDGGYIIWWPAHEGMT
jgi:putative DNA primase/helicase